MAGDLHAQSGTKSDGGESATAAISIAVPRQEEGSMGEWHHMYRKTGKVG